MNQVSQETIDRVGKILDERDELRKEVERLREALKFYAYPRPDILIDEGRRARAALGIK